MQEHNVCFVKHKYHDTPASCLYYICQCFHTCFFHAWHGACMAARENGASEPSRHSSSFSTCTTATTSTYNTYRQAGIMSDERNKEHWLLALDK